MHTVLQQDGNIGNVTR